MIQAIVLTSSYLTKTEQLIDWPTVTPSLLEKKQKEVLQKVFDRCDYPVAAKHFVDLVERGSRQDSCALIIGDMPFVTSRSVERCIKTYMQSSGQAAYYLDSKKRPVGILLFDNAFLKKVVHTAFGQIRSAKDMVEIFYLCLGCMLDFHNKGVTVYQGSIKRPKDYRRVTNHRSLVKALKRYQKRINKKHLQDGVLILDPATTHLSPDCQIEAGTVIHPGTVIRGKTVIGQRAIIGPFSEIKDSTIGQQTQVWQSVVLDSQIGQQTTVGPFAYIRPNSSIGDRVKIGDFVEVKNAVIGNDSKLSHLTYAGDADVGQRVNFGCGTVIVNYDGHQKHRSTVADDVFIGCNTNLVSPVTVEAGAYIAAGSTITNRVPEKNLAIARARQVNKEGWTHRLETKDERL